MDWGPTADNVSMHLFRVDGIAHLPFSFWREAHHNPSELDTIFCARLSVDDLRQTLHRAAWKLMWDWCADRKNRGVTIACTGEREPSGLNTIENLARVPGDAWR